MAYCDAHLGRDVEQLVERGVGAAQPARNLRNNGQADARYNYRASRCQRSARHHECGGIGDRTYLRFSKPSREQCPGFIMRVRRIASRHTR